MSLGEEIRFENENECLVSITDATGDDVGNLSRENADAEWWFLPSEIDQFCADELRAIADKLDSLNAALK